MYYRIRNKERLLHPCEQEQIAAIFLKHGIKPNPNLTGILINTTGKSLFRYVLTKGYSHHSENKYSLL